MSGPDVLGAALRISLALAFGRFGYEKVWGNDWVPMFQAIGLGDWFRYATGGLQMLGALRAADTRLPREAAPRSSA